MPNNPSPDQNADDDAYEEYEEEEEEVDKVP